ncbi:PaaI family thioesterase [Kribbella sp. DT2]|uniref:PaaI family thioesterase n=1 Tax=Kribbella sp. DT2 TaxID=3393427 RepID=UPI003CE8274A
MSGRPTAAGPIVTGGPERLFRIGSITAGRTSVTGSMATGPWSAGPDGTPAAGALGVLVDNVLGYAIQNQRPAGHWSVSTEISIDFLTQLPIDGSPLFAEGRVHQSDRLGGMASGQVIDRSGQIVAQCRQRGRFLPGTPGPVPAAAENAPRTGDLATVIGLSAGQPLAVTADLGNPLANLHGGVMLSVSELTGISALRSANATLVTASIHITYVRPVPVGTRLMFTPTVQHSGRTLGVVQVISTNEAGNACTIATVVAHQPS